MTESRRSRFSPPVCSIAELYKHVPLILPDGGSIGACPRLRRGHVGDEPLVPDVGDGFGNGRMLLQKGFDFAQLNAIAAQLHLMIEAAEELDLAVFKKPGAVARAVDPAEVRMFEEFCRGELGAVQIAASEARRRPATVRLPRREEGVFPAR